MEIDSNPEHGSLDHINTWVFDLDNTLYSSTSRLFDQISERIGQFIAQNLNVALTEAKIIQKSYFHNHGTTLRGLMLEHNVDAKYFLDYVHNIDFSPLKIDETLNKALYSLNGKKIIFTNADVSYSRKVLSHIGISHHFEEIYDIAAANYIPKPYQEAYDIFFKKYDFQPDRSIFFEDILRNLGPAKKMGMTTVWIKNNDLWELPGNEGIIPDYQTDDLPKWLTSLKQ